ncbi:ABC transporter permease [Rhizomonospora bruguierae]|uniref:ABC transporter permease n=1 Tax=Rhizomonospora bruguierae TaxID=1581705 RepID=UPI0020BFA25D|nr:ABC-2 family transporter protein [Micromonospora sp. NBRC 107566]
MRICASLAAAGFRRYSTYRQATIAGAATNITFGLLRTYVLLAVAGGTAAGLAAGYDRAQLTTYVWVQQGLMVVTLIWGWFDLGDRIRSGDVVIDLLRPVPPVLAYFAADVGRAGYAVLGRFVPPVLVGALVFGLYRPARWYTVPLFVLSAALALVICFAGRYMVNATAFWLLDTRGIDFAWVLASGMLSGLYFPLRFLPEWFTLTVWIGTPFPSILQAPADVLVERVAPGPTLLIVAGQAAWAAVMMVACVVVQHRAERRLVVQGG